jgi:ubiquinone/menaquinone biosynthesis C-methylase UbiE
VISDGRDSPTYWETRARPYLGGAEEWRAVTAEGPATVARQYMRFEERGVRLLERRLPHGGHVLDAGCGVGRWFWLTASSRSLIGMDFSAPLLERAAAAANDQGVDLILGDVRDIPARDASFEAAYTVKVLQCLKRADRPTAVAELFRVTAPGGVVVLFEKTRGADGSAPSEWLSWSMQAGGRLVEWHGNGYTLVDRAVAWLVAFRRNAPGSGTSRSTPQDVGRNLLAEKRPGLYAAYTRARVFSLGASLRLEPLAERALPRTWADHGIFVFTK